MAAEEKPVTTEDIDLSDADQKHHRSIRTMMKRHEKMWVGSLGNITVTEHHIEMVTDARAVKYQPYRSGTRTRQIERLESEKQISAGVIEPTNSEWALPVLFVVKKDGAPRYCME